MSAIEMLNNLGYGDPDFDLDYWVTQDDLEAEEAAGQTCFWCDNSMPRHLSHCIYCGGERRTQD